MLDPKVILVPVDFSTFSREAIRTGCRFAKMFGARLILAHVFPPSHYTEGMGFGSPSAAELAARLSEQLEELGKSTVDPEQQWEHHVWSGVPYATIVEEAAAQGVGLIIMPTHGRTGLSHMFIGSTAERVVRKAPCHR